MALATADGHVDRIHGAMDEVAALTRAGEQQSAAILEDMTRISKAVGENLGLVERLSEASDALRSQSERLGHRIGQFTLG